MKIRKTGCPAPGLRHLRTPWHAYSRNSHRLFMTAPSITALLQRTPRRRVSGGREAHPWGLAISLDRAATPFMTQARRLISVAAQEVRQDLSAKDVSGRLPLEGPGCGTLQTQKHWPVFCGAALDMSQQLPSLALQAACLPPPRLSQGFRQQSSEEILPNEEADCKQRE